MLESTLLQFTMMTNFVLSLCVRSVLSFVFDAYKCKENVLHCANKDVIGFLNWKSIQLDINRMTQLAQNTDNIRR